MGASRQDSRPLRRPNPWLSAGDCSAAAADVGFKGAPAQPSADGLHGDRAIFEDSQRVRGLPGGGRFALAGPAQGAMLLRICRSEDRRLHIGGSCAGSPCPDPCRRVLPQEPRGRCPAAIWLPEREALRLPRATARASQVGMQLRSLVPVPGWAGSHAAGCRGQRGAALRRGSGARGRPGIALHAAVSGARAEFLVSRPALCAAHRFGAAERPLPVSDLDDPRPSACCARCARGAGRLVSFSRSFPVVWRRKPCVDRLSRC